jgi:hypothetical protein
MVVNITANINVQAQPSNDEGARVRPDYDFLPLLIDAGFMRDVVAVTEHDFYIFNAGTGLWVKSQLANATGVLRARVAQGAVKGLKPSEEVYLKRYDGAHRVVKSLLNEMQRMDFADLLDRQTPNGTLPMSNGMYNAEKDELRPFCREDMVSRALQYSFVPRDRLPEADVLAVRTFLKTVLPDDEERAYFMRMMALALFGSGKHKIFLILTDSRDGSNGKTEIMRMMEDAFGRFAQIPPREFLHKESKLDISRFKDLTSGASRQGGRQIQKGDVEEFVWTALIVLACNEAAFPTMDASDMPFLKRMKALRMRSVFVDEGDIHNYDGEPHVFVKAGEDRMAHLHSPECTRAMLHELADAYRDVRRAGELGPDPAAVKEVVASITMASDPRIVALTAHLESCLDFDPQRTREDAGKKFFAYLSHKDLLNRTWDDLSERAGRWGRKPEFGLLLKRAMELKGRACRRIQTTTDDFKGYDRVKFMTGPRSTESLSETRFREAAEAALGIRFESSVRPVWLLNVTGACMELDMFNPELKLAIEYDGPQHYEFPNAYHGRLADFEAQRARDRLKERLCAEHGVRLVRIKAVGGAKGVVQELAQLMSGLSQGSV